MGIFLINLQLKLIVIVHLYTYSIVSYNSYRCTTINLILRYLNLFSILTFLFDLMASRRAGRQKDKHMNKTIPINYK